MMQKKQNMGDVKKWDGYYLEDTDCRMCLYFRGKKRGCALHSCCCEEYRLEAVESGRIKRGRGAMEWDG